MKLVIICGALLLTSCGLEVKLFTFTVRCTYSIVVPTMQVVGTDYDYPEPDYLVIHTLAGPLRLRGGRCEVISVDDVPVTSH